MRYEAGHNEKIRAVLLAEAGKAILLHIAGSVTTFMANGAQHAIAIATAAAVFLCNKYGATLRQIHDAHLAELQALVSRFTAPAPAGDPKVETR